MENNEIQKLKVIKTILSQKDEIENNPFSNLPTDSVKKAYALLEEYSEEIKPIKP